MLLNATRQNLNQLSDLLQQLTDNDFSTKLDILSQSSIGMHMRHIIEFYQCLLTATETGILNYDSRKRNKLLETDRKFCQTTIEKIIFQTAHLKPQQLLQLHCDYALTAEDKDSVEIKTSVLRELQYNLEHSVHHMAIIRIGINALNNAVELTSDFGVAASTIRNKTTCAQ